MMLWRARSHQHKHREDGTCRRPCAGMATRAPAASLLYASLKHHLLQAAQFIPC